MLLRLILIIHLTFSWATHALEGELVPKTAQALTIEEGGLFDGTLRFWANAGISDKDDLLKLQGKNIGEYFNLYKIYDVAKSPNNEDVLELSGLFVVIKALPVQAKLELKIGEKVLNLEVRRLNTIATAPPAQEFEYIEQPDIPKTMRENVRNIFYVSLSFIIIAIGMGLFLKSKNKKMMKLKFEATKEALRRAQTRDEVEAIGLNIKYYESELKLAPDKIDNFKTTLDKHQFKQAWTESELEEIKKSLSRLTDA